MRVTSRRAKKRRVQVADLGNWGSSNEHLLHVHARHPGSVSAIMGRVPFRMGFAECLLVPCKRLDFGGQTL